jgi:HSP20 family molecular chaperone IbpA
MSLLSSQIPAQADKTSVADTDTDTGLKIAPRYEIKETPEAFSLQVYLPGVSKDGLDLKVDHAEVRLNARRAWRKPEGWTALHRETSDASYELVFSHQSAFDADTIQAELRDGVLRVTLPKAGAVKPRKIVVA